MARTNIFSLRSLRFFRRAIRLSVAASIVFAFTAILCGDEIASFKQDALATWNKRFARVKALEGSIDHAIECGPQDNCKRYESKYLFSLDYPCFCVEQLAEGELAQGVGDVICFNERYHFRLERREDEAEWHIVSTNAIPKTYSRGDWAHIKSFERVQREETAANVAYGVMALDLQLFPESLLPDLFLNPSFVISNLRRSVESGRELASFDFEFDTKDKSNYMWIRSGSITLDCEEYSIVRAEFQRERWELLEEGATPDATNVQLQLYEIRDATNVQLQRYEIRLEYGDRVKNAPPVIKKRVLSIFDSEGVDTYREEEKITVRSDVSFDAKRFTLTHYGLEEPLYADSKVDIVRWCMIALGGVLIILAIWRKRKRVPTCQEE